MAQITSGLRAILSHPCVYNFFQSLMGGSQARENYVREFIRPRPGDRVLDVGCGTAEILQFLPNVAYWGFDVSASYIAAAKARFGTRGNFFHRKLDCGVLKGLPSFDIVLALGLLHHLDDGMAAELVRLAHSALRPGGRLLTIDPCFTPDQNAISRFLVSHDRGQSVRDSQGYVDLVAPVFNCYRSTVRHQRWIPYTHCIMECTK